MQTEIPCHHCGALNPAGSAFCASCGNALMLAPNSEQEVRTVALSPQPPSPPPAPYSQPPTAVTQAMYNQGQPPQYVQPAPIQPYQQYPPPPPPYGQPQPVGQMPPQQPQYDAYGRPVAPQPPQQQYSQYGQYGVPGQPNNNQYVTPQVSGAYPVAAYGAQPAPLPTAVQRNPVAFWSLWVLATALAWAIAVPAGFALWDAVKEPLLNNVLSGILSNSNSTSMVLIISLAPFFLIVGAVVGLLSGVTQALVLGWRKLKAASWVLTTMIGWMLGALAGWVVTVVLNSSGSQLFTGSSAGLLGDSPLSSGLIMGAIFGAVAGVLLGVAQYLTLQRHSRKAGLWIIASPVGWAIAAAVLVLLLNALTQTSFGVQLSPYLSEALYGAGVGVVAGATTGAMLAAIL